MQKVACPLKFKIDTCVYDRCESLRWTFYRVIYAYIRASGLIYLINEAKWEFLYKFLLEVTLIVCKFIYYFCQL